MNDDIEDVAGLGVNDRQSVDLVMIMDEDGDTHIQIEKLEDALVCDDMQHIPRLGVNHRQPVDLVMMMMMVMIMMILTYK